jgi:hypothetical protein
VANAYVARETEHVSPIKHVLYQSAALAKLDPVTIKGSNTCSILTAVLKHGQGVIQSRCNSTFTDNSYDSTHFASPCWISGTAFARNFSMPAE